MTSRFLRSVLLLSLTIATGVFTTIFSSVRPRAADEIVMPKKPADILQTGAQVNGLGSSGLQPWHIRASYQAFDADGSSQESGTYEEFWVSGTKYKRGFTSPTFTQTEFGTEKGVYRSGSSSWPGYTELEVREQFIDPIPPNLDLRGLMVSKSRRSFGRVELECVTLGTGGAAFEVTWIAPVDTSYCFGPGQPMLRVTSSWDGSGETTYNQIVSFQGRFVARDIRMVEKGRVRLAIHVDEIGGTAPDGSDFGPPSDALPVSDDKITIPPTALRALYLRQVLPHYPDSAKASHVEGTVVLKILVGPEGRVTNIEAVGGPKELRKSATDAVREWEFRPLISAGKACQFESIVEVVFTLKS